HELRDSLVARDAPDERDHLRLRSNSESRAHLQCRRAKPCHVEPFQVHAAERTRAAHADDPCTTDPFGNKKVALRETVGITARIQPDDDTVCTPAQPAHEALSLGPRLAGKGVNPDRDTAEPTRNCC